MPLGDLARVATLSVTRSRAIRARISELGFAERRLAPAETAATGMPEELRVPLVRWTLEREADPVAQLALLFQYQLPVDARLVEGALGRDIVAWLVDAGVVERDGAVVRSRYQLGIVDGVFVWSDDVRADPEAVMTPGPTTLDLLATMPERMSGSVLDVGTGPGTVALIAAARRADRVVATDISQRAVALAEVNATFNELRVDVRAGDMYGPVARERFDWIFAQPPYVTHPEGQPGVTFLHGGAMGDELAMRVLEGSVAHLRVPGAAFVLFDSPVRREATLATRARAVVGPRADIVVFEQPGLDPDRQALGYAALADPTFGETFAQTAVRYRAHLTAKGITEVMHSLVVVRVPPGEDHPAWTESLVVPRFPASWSEIAEFAKGIDLAVAGDDAIAGARVRPRSGAAVVLERAPGATRDTSARSVRFATPGLALDRELTEAGAVIFDLLAAEASVAAVIDRFAVAMERPAAEVRPLVTSFVRDCLVRALLVPA